MYENEKPSDEKEESMNDILTSIRELVYPRRQDAFEKEEAARAQNSSLKANNYASNSSYASDNVVIDLMRPVHDSPSSEIAAREQLLKDAVLRETSSRKEPEMPVIEEELSKEIYRAFSSFEQAVSHAPSQNTSHNVSIEDKIEKIKTEQSSISSDHFLEKLVKEALISSLYQKIEDLASPAIQSAVQALLPQMLDAWMKKNLSALVIECIEKKLDEMKEKAADRRF